MPRHAAPQPQRTVRWVPLLTGLALVAIATVLIGTLILRGAGDDDLSSDGATPASELPPGSGPTETTVAATATTRDPVLGSGAAITIAFGGDTNFEGPAATRLDADPASVLAPYAGVLGGADLAVVNMETALGTGGTPAPKDFTFQAPAGALEAFRAAGVDVVSAANNHGLDFGVESLQETLAAERDLGFPIIGIGNDDAEAFAPFTAEVRGQRVAVIAATQVLDDSLIDEWTAGPGHPGLASAKLVDRLVRAVTEARAASDTVVVFLHWGVETQECPSGSQQELAATLVAAGADVVVGGHAHRVQGGGRMGDAVVHYGLGNFGFQADSAPGARTGVFVVTITGRRVDGYQWVPGRVVDNQPVPLEGAAAEDELARWNEQRGCTGLTE